MEVERRVLRSKPALIYLLMQQVEEQSELCDITVKVGKWVKNFHLCVLIASPFFENAINGNFLEKRIGIVEISVVTAQYVEMAIMFLYGEEPVLTIDTVGDLLEIAEFLMIKSLKYLCICFLRELDISLENCMYVLLVSSSFGFEVFDCIEYIESHLTEVLKEESAMNLSKNSVQYLFSDPRFSYVTMDERLIFLVNWFKKHPEQRKHNVKYLFKTIDLSEVSESVWKDTKLVSVFNKAVDLEHAVRVPEDEKAGRNVLIMTGTYNLIWCLDFKKKQWYRLKSDLFENTTYFRHEIQDITGIKQIRNNYSEIYVGSKSSSKVKTSNLETNNTETYTLISMDEHEKDFTNINVKCNTVFACVDAFNHKEKTINTIPSPQRRRTISIVSSVLYMGYLYRQKENSAPTPGFLSIQDVKMRPIFSLRDEQISEMCIGYPSVALLLKSKHAIIIFDLVNYQLDKIVLTLEESDTIVRYKDGFLIFNNIRCHCLLRLSGPSLSKKYLLEDIKLENDEEKSLRYIFSRNNWLRLVRIDRTDDLKLQYVSHRTLVAGQCPGGVDWKEVSMPQEIKGHIMTTNLFLVRLSKGKLRCHIVCPHCDRSKTETRDYLGNPFSNYNGYEDDIYSHDYEDVPFVQYHSDYD